MRVFIGEREQGVWALVVQGHAGYAPRGRDIVCAAVSILTYTLRAALLQAQAEGAGKLIRARMQPGDAELCFWAQDVRRTVQIFGIIHGGLALLAKKYGAHMQLVQWVAGQ